MIGSRFQVKFLFLLSMLLAVGLFRGTKLITLSQTNVAATAVMVQGISFSPNKIFSTNKDALALTEDTYVLLENNEWLNVYYSCVIAIQNSDPLMLELCATMSHLGLNLLRVVNQDHTNQVSKQRDLSPDEITAIREEGTRLAIVAVELLQMGKLRADVWADAGRPLQRIVLLLNRDLAPYLVTVRTQAVANQPLNFVYRRELGEALLLAGLPLEAIEQLDNAVAYNPQDDKSHDLLALAYYQLEDWEKAEWHARAALSLNPTTEHTYYRRLGEICEAKQDIDCALESYEKLLLVRSDDAFANARLEALRDSVRP